MKKLIVFFIAGVFMAAGCNNSRQSAYTTTHPYFAWEKMNGKVAKVSERTYWAVADGDNFKKGNLLTAKERDSLKWNQDNEITFDTAGNERICMWPDENGKYIGIDLTLYTDNKQDTQKYVWGDTLRGYAVIKCNDQGKAISFANYFDKKDTLRDSWTLNYSKGGDTIVVQNSDNKGVLISKFVNFFNDKGQLTGGEQYNKEGVVDALWKVTYNEKGKISEWTKKDKDGKVLEGHTRTYTEYDVKGNWVKAITKDNKGHTIFSERMYFYYQ